jgi:hypothetical protein
MQMQEFSILYNLQLFGIDFVVLVVLSFYCPIYNRVSISQSNSHDLCLWSVPSPDYYEIHI